MEGRTNGLTPHSESSYTASTNDTEILVWDSEPTVTGTIRGEDEGISQMSRK